MCDLTAENAWSLAMDLDPVPGRFEMLVDQGGVKGWRDEIRDVGVSSRRFGMAWKAAPFGTFSAWVRANYPGDAQIMWWDGAGTAEGINMFAVNTERFVAAKSEAEATSED